MDQWIHAAQQFKGKKNRWPTWEELAELLKCNEYELIKYVGKKDPVNFKESIKYAALIDQETVFGSLR